MLKQPRHINQPEVIASARCMVATCRPWLSLALLRQVSMRHACCVQLGAAATCQAQLKPGKHHKQMAQPTCSRYKKA